MKSKKKLNSIVVDDSEMQRITVAKLINDHPNLELIASYRNGIEVLQNIDKLNVDVIFLDVEMPLVNGFELLKSMKDKPQVIMISSEPQYALKAFDFNVTDYLLKPIESSRFDIAVKKAIFGSYSKKVVETDDDKYIFVKSSLQKVKVKLADINWVEALGDYIRVLTDETSIIVLSSMKSFSEQLPKTQFLRIHKSYIINIEKVEKFTSTTVELCGKKFPLSRNRKMAFKEALDSV